MTIYQGFLKGLQTDYRNAKRGRNELSPGKRAGGGVWGIEEEDYDSTDFIPFYGGRRTVVETDASNFALGCIFSQY